MNYFEIQSKLEDKWQGRGAKGMLVAGLLVAFTHEIFGIASALFLIINVAVCWFMYKTELNAALMIINQKKKKRRNKKNRN